MKSLTRIADLSRSDLRKILDLASLFKQKHDLGIRREDVLGRKVVTMVFEKPSLRTKVAFEAAATYLGATPIFLSSSQILASGSNEKGRESIPDIGRNLERFADLIIARVYSHKTIVELSESVSIPVINALCDVHHPTQALADLTVIRMKKGEGKGLKVAFVGDGNNVANSLMQICALDGIDFSIASPQGYALPQTEQEVARKFASESGSKLAFMEDPKEAVSGADIVYTDTFVSMGQEGERQERIDTFSAYQVNSELMRMADSEAMFMHCLPAHRGEEVTDEVMDSTQSIVFDQAECRLHVARALLFMLLGGER